jgi:hypothetical protein
MFQGFHQRRLREGGRFRVSAAPNLLVSIYALFHRVKANISPMSNFAIRWFQGERTASASALHQPKVIAADRRFRRIGYR